MIHWVVPVAVLSYRDLSLCGDRFVATYEYSWSEFLDDLWNHDNSHLAGAVVNWVNCCFWENITVLSSDESENGGDC
jgi:hypothetical protein